MNATDPGGHGDESWLGQILNIVITTAVESLGGGSGATGAAKQVYNAVASAVNPPDFSDPASGGSPAQLPTLQPANPEERDAMTGTAIGIAVASVAAPFLGKAEAVAGSNIVANAEKGAASEARVVTDLGEAKNTEPVVATEGKSIPDFQTSRTVGEIKDAKQVSNTRQLRIQKEAAQQSGRQHELYTGSNTNVTNTASLGTKVVRRQDLGPKPKR